MSWSFQCLGKPEAVAQALDEQSGKLTGQCKVEFDDALPHLKALVLQNFVAPGSTSYLPAIDFEASGSGSTVNGQQVQRCCTVSIKPTYKTLV